MRTSLSRQVVLWNYVTDSRQRRDDRSRNITFITISSENSLVVLFNGIYFCLFVSYFRKLKSALPFFNAWTLRFSGDSNEFYAGDTTAPVLALHCSETSCVWRPRNRKKILKTMTELTLWILKASTSWCSLVHNPRFFYRNIFDFVKKSLIPWRRFLSSLTCFFYLVRQTISSVYREYTKE